MTRGKCSYLAILFLLAASCAGGREMASVQPDVEPSIDGDLSDWEGRLTSVENGAAAMGIANDDTFLYLALSTSDRARQMQVLTQGMTLWLEADGVPKRGFRFPTGGMRRNAAMILAEAGEFDDEKLEASFQELLADVVLLGEDPEKRIPVAELQGLQVAARLDKGFMAYEVRVPLREDSTSTLALGLPEGATRLRLRLETPEPKGPPGARSGGPPPGGPPSGGGGFEGRPGADFEPPERLEVSIQVTLAGPLTP